MDRTYNRTQGVTAKIPHPNVGNSLWLVLLPPVITASVGLVLLLKLGSGTWMDAQTWPSDFRATTVAADPLEGSGICRAFVFITALLVFVNNILIYLREIKKIGEEAKPGSPRGRLARAVAFWLAFVATLVIFFWLVDTVLSFFPAATAKHEMFGLAVFLVFGVIDYSLAANARETAKDTEGTLRLRLEAEADYYGGQASYTDAAVVMGMLVLVGAEHVLKELPAFEGRFEWGFVSGAIGMHLAYSQFVFLALTLHHRKTLKQIALEEVAALPPDDLEDNK